jgi:crossover junction endodeoxyribonuclease RuvC
VPSSSPKNPSSEDKSASGRLPRRSERSTPVVMGIDPGTRIVGYGAIAVTADGLKLVAAGELRQPASMAIPDRLAGLRGDIDELLMRLDPDLVVVEEAFTSRNVQSALRIAESRGVMLSSAAACGAEVTQLSPSAARKRVVGNGSADKTQVAKMVAAALKLDEIPGTLDVSDALALAIAGAYNMDRARRLAPTTEARTTREA